MKEQKKHAGDRHGVKAEDIALSVAEFEELKKKSDERDEYYNRWMKVHADYENTRKRMEKEKLDYVRFANEMLIARFFPIVDNFDMALLAMDKAEDKEAVMDGIKLVQNEFHKVLEDNGVEKIKTDGEEFDPHVHEAVLAVETDEHPDGMIVEEVRTGYKLNDRLLRPAQVKVAKNKGEDNG
ncbi:MAG: nucleotide exchange factor GrpE [Candidatus Omnitrophica bacterium]|nr:nucleotide exchange factor GrpE [Candidatus Omnitrophota bacterium]MBU1128006.1 nucleotide exchange factor GrpE [Candidatus Omnitrophota bacterium]MBU1784183.1 nucleotide exchange factor GrpE [Candidatus Omnitrophota bacterium]MBU1850891.1 nucleotide exchange factor GrpE [Candidatus Omnitrophota bacterium]